MAEHVLYCGRNVPKANFRAFVYSKDGSQMLTNSWDEYQNAIASGVWFSSKDFAIDKPKKRKS